MTANSADQNRPSVGLFVTCLVDLWRPSVGLAAATLLEEAGCDVTAPAHQTCCGQPAYNAGGAADASDIAKQVISVFEPFDAVVAPSGSCAGMIKVHYPRLLANDRGWSARAIRLAAKTYELTSYLVRVRNFRLTPAVASGRVTFHDSCSSLRELGIMAEPRALLESGGIEVVECADSEICCGFGGAFAVKFPDVSGAMVEAKAARIRETGADCVVSADLGCLLNIAGRLSREGCPIAVRHIAEVLAGIDTPPIGRPRT